MGAAMSDHAFSASYGNQTNVQGFASLDFGQQRPKSEVVVLVNPDDSYLPLKTTPDDVPTRELLDALITLLTRKGLIFEHELQNLMKRKE